MAEPDLRQNPQRGFDQEIDLEARVLVAKIDLAGLEDEPIAPPGSGQAGEAELGDEAAISGPDLAHHRAADVPHQQVGIEILGIDQLVAEPALRPEPHLLDHREELRPAGVRWYSKPLPAARRRSMTPANCSSLRRRASNEEDMRGTPRCTSLKRTLPSSSSRMTSGVQRSASTSAASAIGQNCPYPRFSTIPEA